MQCLGVLENGDLLAPEVCDPGEEAVAAGHERGHVDGRVATRDANVVEKEVGEGAHIGSGRASQGLCAALDLVCVAPQHREVAVAGGILGKAGEDAGADDSQRVVGQNGGVGAAGVEHRHPPPVPHVLVAQQLVDSRGVAQVDGGDDDVPRAATGLEGGLQCGPEGGDADGGRGDLRAAPQQLRPAQWRAVAVVVVVAAVAIAAAVVALALASDPARIA